MLRLLLIICIGIPALFLGACKDKAEQPSSQSETPSEGAMVYNKNCKVCHAQGINGAPILGNTAMWSPRLPKGVATLEQHAISGFGLMPAKGGKSQLSDDEVKAAVGYMVSQVSPSS